jgi:SAM-dependent methyltransferase
MNWSALFEHRYAIHKRWPRIWDVPLARKRQPLLLTQFRGCRRLLEVGADRRRWEPRLLSAMPDLEYLSMDINREHPHDWYDLADVQGSFGGILMLEVIEHLPRDEGVAVLKRLLELLEPQGRLILSTPNIWYPPQYFRDATHVQPWAYDELGGVLEAVGFELEGVWRFWNGTLWQRLLKAGPMGWWHRQLGIDYAKTILLSARKP